MLREAFTTELAEIDLDLGNVQKRINALRDLAKHDQLHPEVIRRLEAKRNTVELIRSHLAEVPALDAQQGARR